MSQIGIRRVNKYAFINLQTYTQDPLGTKEGHGFSGSAFSSKVSYPKVADERSAEQELSSEKVK